MKMSKKRVMSSLENAFESYGRLVARRPWTTIFVSIALCSITAVGFLRFDRQTNWVDLWVDQASVSWFYISLVVQLETIQINVLANQSA